MRPVFDLDQLRALLHDFYELTGIRITVFDSHFLELTTCPEKHAPICELIRNTQSGDDACRACDLDACAYASAHTGGHIYRCHAGLTDAIIPLRVGQTLAGYLLFGQVLSYPTREQAWDAIRALSERFPIDPAQLYRACVQSPLLQESYVQAAAHILHAAASYLILKKIADLQEDSPAERLDAYLRAHFAEPITAQALCEKLQIGKTQLYKLANQLYGHGIAQQIRHMRIEKAQRLLTSQMDLRVSDIAYACGYDDYNYFICVFTRATGLSPSRYRKLCAPDAEPMLKDLK